MIVNHSTQSSTMRAFEALEALLLRTSAITFKGVDLGVEASGCEIDIVAHIDVLGHSHTLACAVAEEEGPEHVRMALEKLLSGVGQMGKNVTPALVVPCLSQETRALCKGSNIGFLDLEGNGCLAFGDMFISTRSLPCRTVQGAAKPPARVAGGSLGRGAAEKLGPARAKFPAAAAQVARTA